MGAEIDRTIFARLRAHRVRSQIPLPFDMSQLPLLAGESASATLIRLVRDLNVTWNAPSDSIRLAVLTVSPQTSQLNFWRSIAPAITARCERRLGPKDRAARDIEFSQFREHIERRHCRDERMFFHRIRQSSNCRVRITDRLDLLKTMFRGEPIKAAEYNAAGESEEWLYHNRQDPSNWCPGKTKRWQDRCDRRHRCAVLYYRSITIFFVIRTSPAVTMQE